MGSQLVLTRLSARSAQPTALKTFGVLRQRKFEPLGIVEFKAGDRLRHVAQAAGPQPSRNEYAQGPSHQTSKPRLSSACHNPPIAASTPSLLLCSSSIVTGHILTPFSPSANSISLPPRCPGPVRRTHTPRKQGTPPCSHPRRLQEGRQPGDDPGSYEDRPGRTHK